MDAPYYNGPPGDDDPLGETCRECGAGPDDPCDPYCECPSCEKRREQEPDGEALRGGESAAWHREHQFTVLRLKK